LSTQQIIAIILTIAAIASYVNYRFIRLPQAIGITLLTVLLSLCVVILGKLELGIDEPVIAFLDNIDFSEAVLNGMLSFLLFAGALHINVLELSRYKWVIGALATVGVVISTFVVGTLLWWVSGFFHAIDIPYIYCLLFGALISPTDPISVMSILKKVNAPRHIEMKISGEALFNDGMGIVMFLMMLGIVSGQTPEIKMQDALIEFIRQAFGGIALGALLGWFVASHMRKVANFEVSALLTLALVTGGYTLSDTVIDVSGPIFMVTAGLIIGNMMRSGHMLDNTINQIDSFWALVDEVLNAVLFVLIGLEMIRLNFSPDIIILALLAIPIVLVSRYISVMTPVALVSKFRKIRPRVVALMTWGGLRGGISIALVLALPHETLNETFFA